MTKRYSSDLLMGQAAKEAAINRKKAQKKSKRKAQLEAKEAKKPSD
jgi:hypothetical protein